MRATDATSHRLLIEVLHLSNIYSIIRTGLQQSTFMVFYRKVPLQHQATGRPNHIILMLNGPVLALFTNSEHQIKTNINLASYWLDSATPSRIGSQPSLLPMQPFPLQSISLSKSNQSQATGKAVTSANLAKHLFNYP